MPDVVRENVFHHDNWEEHGERRYYKVFSETGFDEKEAKVSCEDRKNFVERNNFDPHRTSIDYTFNKGAL